MRNSDLIKVLPDVMRNPALLPNTSDSPLGVFGLGCPVSADFKLFSVSTSSLLRPVCPSSQQFLGIGTDPCLSVSCIWCHRLTGKCREACSWSTSWVPSKLSWSVWAATMKNNTNWVAYKQQTFIPRSSEGRSRRSGVIVLGFW